MDGFKSECPFCEGGPCKGRETHPTLDDYRTAGIRIGDEPKPRTYSSICREAAAMYDIQAGAEFKPDSQDGEDIEAAKLATDFLRSLARDNATYLRNLAGILESLAFLRPALEVPIMATGKPSLTLKEFLDALTTPLKEKE